MNDGTSYQSRGRRTLALNTMSLMGFIMLCKLCQCCVNIPKLAQWQASAGWPGPHQGAVDGRVGRKCSSDVQTEKMIGNSAIAFPLANWRCQRPSVQNFCEWLYRWVSKPISDRYLNGTAAVSTVSIYVVSKHISNLQAVYRLWIKVCREGLRNGAGVYDSESPARPAQR